MTTYYRIDHEDGETVAVCIIDAPGGALSAPGDIVPILAPGYVVRRISAVEGEILATLYPRVNLEGVS